MLVKFSCSQLALVAASALVVLFFPKKRPVWPSDAYLQHVRHACLKVTCDAGLPGEIMLRLLKMLVLPLIAGSMIAGAHLILAQALMLLSYSINKISVHLLHRGCRQGPDLFHGPPSTYQSMKLSCPFTKPISKADVAAAAAAAAVFYL